MGGWPVAVKAEIPKEYQIKAVFLFNFVQFVQWPPTAFSSPDQPFCIGVLGENPFGSFLEETIRNEKVGEHPLIVRYFKSVEEVKDCQMLFVNPSENGRSESILKVLKGRNILTVGDKEGFEDTGGIVRFATEKNKIHLRISLKAAKAAKLRISSKLLRLAEIVDGKGM
jgi:hypothetical protein